MQERKTVRACNFYVSEWHLFAALLPYLKDELKKKNKIIFISQDKLEKGLRELVDKINIKFENENGLNDITWLNENLVMEIREECTPATIIVQGTYEFIEEINQYLEKNLVNLYQDCTIINCYEVFDTNTMLYNILEKHDYVFNTGGLHKKEEIFPEYKSAKIASSL
ncbi:MAG: hypothetical protein IJ217_00970 [Clostridia bacterium]|nr:hypothetical protein [Clostridia bacterium]